jgi:hypothetical protein
LVTGSDDGIHVMETTPSTNGSSEASNGATDVAYWLGDGATAGVGSNTYTVQPFGICFTDTTINHTQVVVSSTSGPTSSGGWPRRRRRAHRARDCSAVAHSRHWPAIKASSPSRVTRLIARVMRQSMAAPTRPRGRRRHLTAAAVVAATQLLPMRFAAEAASTSVALPSRLNTPTCQARLQRAVVRRRPPAPAARRAT